MVPTRTERPYPSGSASPCSVTERNGVGLPAHENDEGRMRMPQSYFTARPHAGGEVLTPQQTASSGWNVSTMRGPAVSGALAREVERVHLRGGRLDLRPARWTVDLCAPTPMRPFTVNAKVLQESRRLLLISAEVTCEGAATARAKALFLKPTETPDHHIWQSNRKWAPPPASMKLPIEEPSLYASETADWSARQGDAQDATRKRSWHAPSPIVEGEEVSPFQAVASVADLASLVMHWGTEGIAHINADITLAIARLPASLELGLVATDRVEHDGIAIGTAAMFDRHGTIGTVVISALANAKRVMDLKARDRLGRQR